MMTTTCFLVLVTLACTASAQSVRLANGTIVQGQVTKNTREGLEIQTAAGPKILTWDTLSMGTRFRYEPAFKANIDAVLQGRPASSRTRVPDPEESTQDAASAPTATPAPVVAEPVTARPDAPATLLIWDHFTYENNDSFRAGGFPSKALRAPSYTYYHGLQFGPEAKDVVYLAIDPKDNTEARDLLLVYSPYSALYTNAMSINGFKKGGGVVNFKKFPLRAQFGAINAAYDMEYTGLANDEEMLTAVIELSRGDQKCRFILGGLFRDTATGNQIIGVNGLIDLPRVSITLDPKETPIKIKGDLLMSGLKLVPKENMDNRLNVEIFTADGTLVQKEAIKLDEASLMLPSQFSLAPKKMTPGETYRVKSTINLGPFLGPVTDEDTISLPNK
ncbi:MAG: hypothetical protein V2A34_13415 [Lentisphaerota bacterium]